MAKNPQPDDRTMSKPGGYRPVEDINQGPHGARGGKVAAGHGQNSDGGGNDDLVPLNPMQHDPYRANPADWPVKDVDAADGQSGPTGTAEGKNLLVTLSETQGGPRFVEDGGAGSSGAGTPTGWHDGGRSAKIAAAFPIRTNDGEANQEGGEIPIAESVNLMTGYIEAKTKRTRVQEVPEEKLSIPSR